MSPAGGSCTSPSSIAPSGRSCVNSSKEPGSSVSQTGQAPSGLSAVVQLEHSSATRRPRQLVQIPTPWQFRNFLQAMGKWRALTGGGSWAGLFSSGSSSSSSSSSASEEELELDELE